MSFGENSFFQMKKIQQKHNNFPKTVRKQDTKSVIGSTSKISHLTDVFVVGKAKCGPTCVFGSIFPKITENPVETRITTKLTGNKAQSLFIG